MGLDSIVERRDLGGEEEAYQEVARRLGLRAELYLQVGRNDDATVDARKAREINSDLTLSPELEALL